MADAVTEFFMITGLDMVPPETFAELIPYLLSVLIGVSLVSCIFGIFGKLIGLIMDFTRWR